MTRVVGEVDETVLDHGASVDEIVPPVDIRGMELDDKEVVHRRADVRAGDGADRAGHVVRRDRDVIHVGKIGDDLGFTKSTHLRDIRSNDPGGLIDDQFPETVLAIDVFAGAYRRAGAVGDMALGFDVFGWDGVFQPEEIERFECLGEFDRVVDAVFPMGIHPEHRVGSDGFAALADDLDHPFEFGIADRPIEGFEPLSSRMRIIRDVDRIWVRGIEVEFERGEPGVDDFFRLFRVVGWIRSVASVAVGIDPDFVAEFSAEHVVDRGVKRATDEIPEGDFDPADRGDGGAAGRPFARHAADHHFIEFADVEGAFADQQFAGFVDGFSDTDTPVGFTETGDPFVGFDANEDPREIAIDDGGTHTGDLHVAPFLHQTFMIR